MPAEAVHAIYACPRCGASDALHEDVTVPGKRRVDATLAPVRRVETADRRAEGEGTYVCGDCGWEGARLDLLLDGEPQTRPARGQLVFPRGHIGPARRLPSPAPVAPAVLRQVRA